MYGVDFMKKRHNTLDYKYFHKTKYIKTLEREFNIANFKTEYIEQFDIMYDIFKTLILVNNIVFADSNKNKQDKITDIIIELEKCIYGDLDNDSNKYKYSVRQINKLLDKHTRYLFKKFIEWYEYLSNIGKLDNVAQEIEKEMYRLENINFDKIIEKHMTYKKDKNSDYKIYLCKFNRICYDNKFEEKYKTDFEKYYGTLSNDEYYILKNLFNLVASANNGIINELFNKPLVKITDTDTHNYIFNLYLNTLNISVSPQTMARRSIIHISCCQEIFEYFEKDMNITFNDIANNFDLYNFIYELNSNQSIWKEANKDITKTLLNELNHIYKLYNENKLDKALEITHNIIERNKDLFIRIS